MLFREARLRPEWGELYPAVRPGQWQPAAMLADRLLADALLRGIGTALRGRVLPDAHFEFRGGNARGGERAGMRPHHRAFAAVNGEDPEWMRRLAPSANWTLYYADSMLARQRAPQ